MKLMHRKITCTDICLVLAPIVWNLGNIFGFVCDFIRCRIFAHAHILVYIYQVSIILPFMIFFSYLLIVALKIYLIYKFKLNWWLLEWFFHLCELKSPFIQITSNPGSVLCRGSCENFLFLSKEKQYGKRGERA